MSANETILPASLPKCLKEFRTYPRAAYLGIILIRTALRLKRFHGKGKAGWILRSSLSQAQHPVRGAFPWQNSSGDAPIFSPGAPGLECPSGAVGQPHGRELCVLPVTMATRPGHLGTGRWPWPWQLCCRRGFHGQSQHGKHTRSFHPEPTDGQTAPGEGDPGWAGTGGTPSSCPWILRLQAGLIPTGNCQKAEKQLRGMSVLCCWHSGRHRLLIFAFCPSPAGFWGLPSHFSVFGLFSSANHGMQTEGSTQKI